MLKRDLLIRSSIFSCLFRGCIVTHTLIQFSSHLLCDSFEAKVHKSADALIDEVMHIYVPTRYDNLLITSLSKSKKNIDGAFGGVRVVV